MVTMFTLLVTDYSIDYTITSTFLDDGFVTDAKTTPTLFESLQKKGRGLYRRITTSTIFKFNVLYLTKTLDRLTSIYS